LLSLARRTPSPPGSFRVYESEEFNRVVDLQHCRAVAGSEDFIDRARQTSVMVGTTLDPAAAEDMIADVTQALNRI